MDNKMSKRNRCWIGTNDGMVHKKINCKIRHNGFRRHAGKGVPGYLTVEASLLLPIVLGTIIFVISFQLFGYNRCLMEQNTAMLAIHGAADQTTDPDRLKKVISDWKEEFLTDKWVGWNCKTTAVSLGHNVVRVTCEGYLFGEDSKWSAAASSESRIIKPASFLRIYRRLRQSRRD